MSAHELDLAQALGALPAAVVVVDETGLICHVNIAARQLHAGLAAGLHLQNAFRAEERQRLAVYLQSLSSLASGRDTRYMEGHLRAQSGRSALVAVTGKPMSSGSVDSVLLLVDITEQRGREQALEALAHTDPLTGLPNRLALLQMLKNASRADAGCVIAMADLDRFKQINDCYGHAVGDSLLQAVATAWRATLPSNALLARIGGDEFCIILPGLLDNVSLDCLQQVRQIDLSAALAERGENSQRHHWRGSQHCGLDG